MYFKGGVGMKERIKKVRKSNNLTMEQFGKKIGITKSSVSLLESGKNSPSEQTLKLICQEFNINKEWLSTGVGEMYNMVEDETAVIVSDLLEKQNPMYDIIKGIMKIYQKLDQKSQKVIDDFAEELSKELRGD